MDPTDTTTKTPGVPEPAGGVTTPPVADTTVPETPEPVVPPVTPPAVETPEPATPSPMGGEVAEEEKPGGTV